MVDDVSQMIMSHYDNLGAQPTAEYAEIRSRYRAAILALHPDKVSSNQGPRGTLHRAFGDGNLLQDQIAEEKLILPHMLVSKIKELGLEQHQFDSSSWNRQTRGTNLGEAAGGEQDVLARFVRVQKAWEVLRDPKSRAEYDSLLRSQKLAHRVNSRDESIRVIVEEICLPEMDVSCVDGDNLNVLYTYSCRCGDSFVVSQEEFRFVGVVFDKASQGTSIIKNRSRSGVSEHAQEQPSFQKEGEGEEASPGVHYQTSSLVVPCQSCSLHIRVHLYSD